MPSEPTTTEPTIKIVASDFDFEEDWEKFCPPLEKKSTDNTALQPDSTPNEGSEESIDPYQVRTKRTFANHPYSKGILVLGVVSAGAVVVITLLRLVTGGFAPTSVAKVQPSPSPNSVFDDNSPTDAVSPEQVEELQTQNAMGQQVAELKQINQTPITPKKAQLLAKSQETEPSQRARATQPVNPSRTYVPPPPPVKRSVYSEVNSSPSPIPRRSVPIDRNNPQPFPVSQVNNTPPVDPLSQWVAAASIGSYGTVEPPSNTSTVPSEVETSIPLRSETDSSRERVLSPSPIASNSPSQNNSEPLNVSTTRQEVLMGTRATAEIETPIVWAKGQEKPSQNYLVRLKDPLKDSKGEVVIPADSYLSVELIDAGSTGIVQLAVTAIIMSSNGQQQQHNISPGSILILGKGGGILQAKAQRRSTVGTDIMGAVLGGVGNAAGLLNRPSGASYSQFGSSIQYGDTNAAAGFVEGATNNIVNSLQRSNEQARSSAQSEPDVFVLKGGTDVQVFVNQTFSF